MGMEWANGDGLRQAAPPAYTEWIGTQLRELVEMSRMPESL